MKQNYKALLTTLIVFLLIIDSVLVLFDVISASEVSTPKCEPYQISHGCDEAPKKSCPDSIQVCPTLPCPLHAVP